MEDYTGFQWDDAKAAGNLRKHGVDFIDARLVFKDYFAIHDLDVSHSFDEERMVVTGMAGNVLLKVVYTERDDKIRIITARRANRHEQAEYYYSQSHG